MVTHLLLVLTRYGVHKMEKIIHNVETNELVTADLSAKEVAEIEAVQLKEAADLAKRKAEEKVTATAKAALLEKLGITADEAALLLA